MSNPQSRRATRHVSVVSKPIVADATRGLPTEPSPQRTTETKRLINDDQTDARRNHGPRFDVEWRLPDRTKRSQDVQVRTRGTSLRSFACHHLRRRRHHGSTRWPGHAGERSIDVAPSRLDLSPKVRRGYGDNWRNRIEPRFGEWHIARIDHHRSSVGQRHGRVRSRPADCPLGSFGPEDVAGLRDRRRPAPRPSPPRAPSFRRTTHARTPTCPTGEVAALAASLRRSGRRRRTAGLHRSAIRRAGRPVRRRRRS